MNSLSGFNSQEIRRLHPYLSALLRRVKALEAGGVRGEAKIEWGTDGDIVPTGNSNSGGVLNKAARADHQHLFKFPVAIPLSTPDGAAYFDLSASAINIYVGGTPTTKVVAGGEAGDVKPTGVADTGTAPRYAFADHSHPTALLPEGDPQPPVENEIRFNTEDKVVRWDGSAWVPLSVEAGGGEGGTEDDVQPTKLRDAGTAPRFARADHSHPTAILPLSDPQTPEIDEIRYNDDNKIVRWDGTNWVLMSFEAVAGGLLSDVQPTKLRSAGSSTRFAKADHSHPTAILPQSDAQTPVVDEIRYTGTNRLVRWNGTAWVDFIGALPVPADPLVLPLTSQVSSPQNRQLVNHSAWDGIGNATLFYYDSNNSQYRLAFARPLVVAIASTPSGKDVWASKANELAIKYHSSNTSGAAGVLWSRGGNTTTWSPLTIQLSDSDTTLLPTDVGVLARSPLTGTSGSRRWFLRGVQEGGSFRAPFVGFPSFTASGTPAHTDLSTSLGDGYAYFIYDYDRMDIVRPITDGNKYPSIFSHAIVAPPCRTFHTTADPSGHYVVDEIWNNIWVVSYYTTTSATTDLWARLPTIPVGLGVRAGRVLLYLHNPQSSAISPVFAVAVYVPTSTGVYVYTTANTTINIPATSTTVADLGHLAFSPSTAISHHRSHLITIGVVRRKGSEAANNHKVILLGVVIVPQRAA
jgi:hypothetical protein